MIKIWQEEGFWNIDINFEETNGLPRWQGRVETHDDVLTELAKWFNTPVPL